MAISSKKHQTALPREIIAIILAKLPTETMRQFKLVCKEWRDIIISDSLFAETHYKNSNINLLIPCKSYHPTNGLFMIESYEECTKIHKIESLKLNLNFDKGEFKIVNTCRGFLFLKRRIASCRWSQLLICNPLTNEYMKLPEIQSLYSGNLHLGFGFSPTTKQYKVVKLVHHLKKSYRVDIHTIGTSRWGRIKEFPCQYKIWIFCNNPVDFNGVLHWSALDMKIACFNIDKEELDFMSMPCGVEVGWCHEIRIGVINALLCISLWLTSNSSLKLWVMKDYGVEESWTQYVVIKPGTIPKLDRAWFNGYQLVEVRRNGKVLLLLPNKLLISYNPKKKRTRILQVWDNDSRPEFFKAQLFMPSFFSLRNLCDIGC